MDETSPSPEIVELTADIVASYVSNNTVVAGELSDLIGSVYDALGHDGVVAHGSAGGGSARDGRARRCPGSRTGRDGFSPPAGQPRRLLRQVSRPDAGGGRRAYRLQGLHAWKDVHCSRLDELGLFNVHAPLSAFHPGALYRMAAETTRWCDIV